jgi:uncharacterized SAM-binding protein YcdF (DUF218 family)
MKKNIYIILVLAAVLATGYLLYPFALEGLARFLIVRDKLEPADMIVVLAGDDNGERVEEAIAIYRQGYSKKMLMTGGPLAWRLTHAEWMKKHALARGIPKRAVMIEDKSRSTLENAEFSLPLLKKQKVRSIILVTSPLHSRRARRVFKRSLTREGIKLISSPVYLENAEFELPKWWARHEDTQVVLWEYGSFLYYLLRGY